MQKLFYEKIDFYTYFNLINSMTNKIFFLAKLYEIKVDLNIIYLILNIYNISKDLIFFMNTI